MSIFHSTGAPVQRPSIQQHHQPNLQSDYGCSTETYPRMEHDHKKPVGTSLVASDVRLLRYQADSLHAENEYLLKAKKTHSVFEKLPKLPKPFLEFYWTTTRFIGLSFLHDGTWPKKKERLGHLFRRSNTGRKNVNLLPCNGGSQRAPRILVDVSATAASPAQTGIQRYVREFARAAFTSGSALPVLMESDQLFDAYSDRPKENPLRVEAADTLLLLDSNWRSDSLMARLLAAFKSQGGRVVVFFHDIVPLRFPYTCHKDTIDLFTSWFNMVTYYADAYITSTHAGANDLAAAVQSVGHGDRPIGWVSAGTNLSAHQTYSPSTKIADFFRNSDLPVFLSVGTMEPRKGYAIALAAFDELWSNGHDVQYLIMGTYGWGMRAFEQEIRSHPNYGKRLLWSSDASDTDLRWAYEHATALVAPSIAEGFGIPIIEAAEFGLPMILSDIPVFREVTEDKAIYFEVGNAHALKQALESFEVRRSANNGEIKVISWNENVTRMTEMIRTQTYQWPSTPK